MQDLLPDVNVVLLVMILFMPTNGQEADAAAICMQRILVCARLVCLANLPRGLSLRNIMCIPQHTI